MRSLKKPKQIMALLLTSALITAMAPLNVIGAPTNEDPSPGSNEAIPAVKTSPPTVALEVSSENISKELDGRTVFDSKADVKFTVTDASLSTELLETGAYFTYSLDGNDVSPTSWREEESGVFSTSFEVTDEGEHSVSAEFVKDAFENADPGPKASQNFAVDCNEAEVNIRYEISASDNLISPMVFGIYRPAGRKVTATITVTDEVAGVAKEDILVNNTPDSGTFTFGITNECAFTTNDNGKTWTATYELKSDFEYLLSVSTKDRMDRADSEAKVTYSPDTVKDEDTGAIKEIALTDGVPVIKTVYNPVNSGEAPITEDFAFHVLTESSDTRSDSGHKEVRIFIYSAGPKKPEPDENGRYDFKNMQRVVTYTDTGDKITTDVNSKYELADKFDDIFSIMEDGTTGDTYFSEYKITERDYKITVNTTKGLKAGYYIVRVFCQNNTMYREGKYNSSEYFDMFEVDSEAPDVEIAYSKDPTYTDGSGTQYFDGSVTLTAKISDTNLDAAYLNENDIFDYSLTDSSGKSYRFGKWIEKDGSIQAGLTLKKASTYSFAPVSISDSLGNTADLSYLAKEFAADLSEASVSVDYATGITKSRANSGMPFGMYRPAQIEALITVSDDIAGVDPDSIVITNNTGETAEEITGVDLTTDDGGRTYTGTLVLTRNKPYNITVCANDRLGRSGSQCSLTYSVNGRAISVNADEKGNYPELAYTNEKPVIDITACPDEAVSSRTDIEFEAFSAPDGVQARSGLKNIKVTVDRYAVRPVINGNKVTGEAERTAEFTDNGKTISSSGSSALTLARKNNAGADFSQEKTDSCGYTLSACPGAEGGLASGYYVVTVTAENNILRNDGSGFFETKLLMFEVDVTAPAVGFTYSSGISCTPADNCEVFDDTVTITATVEDANINAALLNSEPGRFAYALKGPHDTEYSFGEWEDRDGKAVSSVTLSAEGFYCFEPSSMTDKTGNTASLSGSAKFFGVDKTEAAATVSYSSSVADIIAEVLTFGLYTSNEINVNISFSDAVAGIKTDSIRIYNDADGGHEDITGEFEFADNSGYTNHCEATATLKKNIAYVISVEVRDNLDRSGSENSSDIVPTELADENDPSKQTKEVASMDDTDTNKPIISMTAPAEWNDNSAEPLELSFSVRSVENESGKADPGLKGVKAELFFAASAAKASGGDWTSVAEFNDNGNGVETVNGYTLSGNGTESFGDTKTSSLDYTLSVEDKTSGYYKLVVTAENNTIESKDGDAVTYFASTEEQQFGIDNEEPVLVRSYDNYSKAPDEDEEYYNAPRTLTITLTETSFDLDYVKEHYSNIFLADIPRDDDQLSWELDADKDNVFIGTVTFRDYQDEPLDGHYSVFVRTIEDKLGKSCVGFSDSFFIDETAPEISWRYDYDDPEEVDGKYYYSDSRTLTVIVSDRSLTADDLYEDSYLVYSVTNEGADIAEEEKSIRLNWMDIGMDEFIAEYTFDIDGEYRVLFESLRDKAGNQAVCQQFGSSEEFIIDNTDPVFTWEYDDYGAALTKCVENGRTVYYYDNMRTLTATIIEHNLTLGDLSDPQYLDYSIKDEHGNNIVLDWQETDDPDTFTASVDLDDTEEDAYDGGYTVVFNYLYDRAYRPSENSDSGISEEFVVDRTAPVITVGYVNDNGCDYPDENGLRYYNDSKKPLKLKVTVNEHNFSAEDIEKFISYGISDEHGKTLSFDKWIRSSSDRNLFTAEFEFTDVPSDTDDGSYSVRVTSLSDKVGHRANDENGDEFSGHRNDRIVIDYTAPVVTYSYDNNKCENVDGTDYFDKNRTITVTVTDHGIRSAEMLGNITDLSVSSKNGAVWTRKFVGSDKWKRSGNKYTYTYTFKDSSAASDGDYKVELGGFSDPAGNKAVDNTGKEKSSFIDDSFVIDTTAPVITITYDPARPARSYKGRTYYDSQMLRAKITVEEYNFKNSGDRGFNIAEYRQDSLTGEKFAATTLNGGFSWTLDGENKYVTYIDLPGNSYLSYFNFATKDKAGNPAEKKPAKSQFVIDDTAPKNLSVKFEKSVADVIIGALTFGCYNSSTNVTISAEDETAGIEYLEYQCVGVDGSESFGGMVDMKSGNADPKTSASYTFRVNPDFRGYVILTVRDFSGNTSVYSTAGKKTGIIVDANHPKYESVKPVVKAQASSAPRNGIFNSDVLIDVDVYDPVSGGVASGIDRIEYIIRNPLSGAEQKGTLKNTDTSDNTFNTSFTVNSRSFNSNGVSITIYAYDNASNRSDRFDLTVDIDIIRPTVNIEYQSAEPNIVGGIEYYGSERTAVITVRERNFDPADFKYKIENTIPSGSRSVPTISGWTHNIDEDNPDASTHTTRIVFSDDGYYSTDISFMDKAGNISPTPAAAHFRIDRTDPEISISFDNDSAQNNNYYSRSRTAYITVKEMNFSWDSLVCRIDARSADNLSPGNAPKLTSMTDNGDMHTAVLVFDDDGMFSFTVDDTDHAGNKARRVSIGSFYIDRVKPSLVISGVKNNVAYAGNVEIDIYIDDINYSGDYSYKLERIDSDSEKSNVTDQFAFSIENGGRRISLDSIPDEKENDGIYILSATSKDKAGNSTSGAVRFSVNRYGSTYMLDENTAKINQKCINKEQDIVISEFNSDPIGKDEVIITVGGRSLNLSEGKDYSVDITGNVETWYQAVYTIKSTVFEENGEGLYKVLLKSKDKKLNSVNCNNDIDRSDENGAEKLVISFVVDKQAPLVAISGLEDDTPYREDTKTITIMLQDSNFSDDLTENKVSVSVGGKTYDVRGDQIRRTESGYLLTLDVSGDGKESDIVVTVTDRAGNVGYATVKGFTLKASELQMFLDNRVAVIFTIAGFIILMMIIAIVSFIVAKKRKKHSGKAE